MFNDDRVNIGSIEQVFGGNSSPRVGSFRFYFEDQRWEWSPEVARMHGYTDDVRPTTDLLLSHKHPEDRDRVAVVIQQLLSDGRPFSSRHRIIDVSGQTHHVLVVGDRMLDESGRLIGTDGFYVDLTEFRDSELRESLDAAVAELAESRAVIEQVKGMLMLVYDITAQRAFDVLRWRSQETNTKLRVLAEQLSIDARTALLVPQKYRESFDHLLMTAHERAVQRRN